jgi:hypothetical protein
MRSALATRTVAQIDHVVLILDRSGSMQPLRRKIIEAVQAQVNALAKRSQAMKREVRVSVYAFGSVIECLIFDTDVLRLPSIAELYEIEGMTKLADAIHKGLDDLATTSTLYGDHAFLLLAMTDGRENDSSTRGLAMLPGRLQSLPENWTAGLLVPSEMARFEAEALGFAKGNIGVWGNDVAEFERLADAGVESFTSSRLSGQRSTTNLFGNGPQNVNRQSVASLDLVSPTAYRLLPVPGGRAVKYESRAFVEGAGLTYTRGCVYYQWTKGETIQAHKEIVVLEKRTDRAYSGAEARRLIGLPPDVAVQGSPQWNPDYETFIQSKTHTRKLIGGTRVLVMV